MKGSGRETSSRSSRPATTKGAVTAEDIGGSETVVGSLGSALTIAKRYDEAIELLAEGVRVKERFYGPNDPTLPPGLSNLGNALRFGGRREEARDQ